MGRPLFGYSPVRDDDASSKSRHCPVCQRKLAFLESVMRFEDYNGLIFSGCVNCVGEKIRQVLAMESRIVALEELITSLVQGDSCGCGLGEECSCKGEAK